MKKSSILSTEKLSTEKENVIPTLHYAHLGNGLTLWEDNDKEYKGHIDYDRKITLRGTFHQQNKEKISTLASKYNTTADFENKILVLCPLNPPSLTHTNPVTHEVYKMSVEIVDGKECVVYGRYIFDGRPEDYQKL